MVSGAATVRYPQCLRREPGGGAGGDTDEVAEFRGNADEPDRPDPASRDTPEPVGDSRSARARVEPRSRAEYAADLEQRALWLGGIRLTGCGRPRTAVRAGPVVRAGACRAGRYQPTGGGGLHRRPPGWPAVANCRSRVPA